jgi:hypothetical protein
MAEFVESKDGVVTVTLEGTLTQAALVRAQRAVGEIIRAEGKVRILVIARKFEGWERRGTWDDLSFQEEFDPSVEKMAIVGDKRWEDLALMFAAKDFRGFPIEYFGTDEIEKARSWLKPAS